MTPPPPKVTVVHPAQTNNKIAKKNVATILEFFSLYLVDKEKFYSLWVSQNPSVITPFVSDDIAICKVVEHTGWDAIKKFWDPIFDEMKGKFDWVIDDFIVGEDPDTIVTRAQSDIDVQTGDAWGNKHIAYQGRYVQIFKFHNGKVLSFEEYYDTALLNAQYS